MADSGGNTQRKSARLRRFAITAGAGIVILFGLAVPCVSGLPYPVWPWLTAALLGAWGFVAPLSLRPVYRGWSQIALILGKLTMPLALGAVFFLVFTPVGRAMRMWQRDRLSRVHNDDVASYRVQSQPQDPSSMERPN